MLLIDAFNVLHLPEAVRDGRAMDLAGLAGLLGGSRYAGRRATLVCDGTGVGPDSGGTGHRSQLRLGGVEVVFSGAKSTADDEIEARLKRAGGHGVTVVSDDRRLRRAAGRAGAKALGSGTFLAHLLADDAKPKAGTTPRFTRDIPLDPYSVVHWMRAFGISPNGVLDRRAGKAAGPAAKGGAGKPELRTKKGEEKNEGGVQARSLHHKGETPEAPPPIPDERVLRMESLADDPVIREALDAWKGRLTLDDLDMARWLSEHPPGSEGGRDQR